MDVTGRLDGRVAVVTGAGDGIGRAIAGAFVAEGARVLVAERDEANGEAAVDALGERGPLPAHRRVPQGGRGGDDRRRRRHLGDRRRPGQQRLGRRSPEQGREQERRALRARLRRRRSTAPCWAMQAAFPMMRDQGYGRIINLCSLNGVNAHIGTAEYNSAKEALRALTRTAAREWAAPWHHRQRHLPRRQDGGVPSRVRRAPRARADGRRRQPHGPPRRPGRPTSPRSPSSWPREDSRYLTGNTLFVDGGSHINGSPWAPELPDD